MLHQLAKNSRRIEKIKCRYIVGKDWTFTVQRKGRTKLDDLCFTLPQLIDRCNWQIFMWCKFYDLPCFLGYLHLCLPVYGLQKSFLKNKLRIVYYKTTRLLLHNEILNDVINIRFGFEFEIGNKMGLNQFRRIILVLLTEDFIIRYHLRIFQLLPHQIEWKKIGKSTDILN